MAEEEDAMVAVVEADEGVVVDMEEGAVAPDGEHVAFLAGHSTNNFETHIV